MFRNILTKSVRDYRWAILGWGAGMGFLVYVVYVSFKSVLGTFSQAAVLQQLGNEFRFVAEPVALNTPGGYVTWKYGALLPLVIGIWTILAGARMVRGEEERGSMDILLATPQARARVLLQKVGALSIATGLIGLLIALISLGGMAAVNAQVDLGGALFEGLDVGLTVLFFGVLALLLAQFMSRGAAAGWAGGLMALSYLIDGAGREFSGLSGLQRVSPFFYYQLSKPLVPSYGTNPGALVVLAALSAVGIALAVPLFARRDVGRTVFADLERDGAAQAGTAAERSERALADAQHRSSVRAVWLRALRQQRNAIAWWIVSLFLLTGFLVIVTRAVESQVQQLLGNNSIFSKILGGQDLATNAGFLSGLLFIYLPLLLSLFAGLIAYNWASDLDQGRLELVLSTPEPRWRAMLERFAAVTIAAIAAAVGVWLAILAGAYVSGLSLDVGHVTLAALGLLPLELVTAALVYALAGVLGPGLVLTVLSLFLGVSFLATELTAVLNLPSWVEKASIFYQYGSPLTTNLNWGAFFGMLGVAAVLLLIGETQFTQRDVAAGAA
jgi:ABC-2 type transport system permease protein